MEIIDNRGSTQITVITWINPILSQFVLITHISKIRILPVDRRTLGAEWSLQRGFRGQRFLWTSHRSTPCHTHHRFPLDDAYNWSAGWHFLWFMVIVGESIFSYSNVFIQNSVIFLSLSLAHSGSLWVTLTCNITAVLQHFFPLWRLVMLFYNDCWCWSLSQLSFSQLSLSQLS